LETIRGLMSGSGSIDRVIPLWLQPVLLGFGDPAEASYKSAAIQKYASLTPGVTSPDSALDFGDTFLDEAHLRDSFSVKKIVVDGRDKIASDATPERTNYRIKIKSSEIGKSQAMSLVEASSYPFPGSSGGNSVRFTQIQVEAIRSGLSPGLTLVVGPPGTGT
jgi:intron-binding protein aquarius